MVLILIGQTASGKSTIKDILVEKADFEPIVTYTTRPKRRNERDGIDYHFITEEEFDAMDKLGMFIETTEYDADFGHCRYGSALDDYRGGGNKIIVLNPDGAKIVKELSERFGFEAVIVLIELDHSELVRRALARGDKPTEINRRIIADTHKFDRLIMSKIPDVKVVLEDDLSPDESASRVWNAFNHVWLWKEKHK